MTQAPRRSRVRAALGERRLTVAWLARRLGMSRSAVSNIVNAPDDIERRMLDEIERAVPTEGR